MTTHATIEQLIDIRDGIESPLATHLAECKLCQAELASLDSLGADVFAAVDQAPPADAWARIQNTLQAQNEQGLALNANANAQPAAMPLWQTMTGAVYALAASLAFVGLVSVWMFSQQTDLRHQNQMLQASINELMINSRGLEQVLQQVADQNRQLSASHQAVADRLYWRLTNVDQKINELDPNSPDSVAQAELLWNERIDALNELNKLYYQSTAVAQTARY